MKENIDPNWIGTDEIYRENILDHYKNPHNLGNLDSYTSKHREFNPVCGDDIEIFINIENSIVKDVKFIGKGCAISIATASMLTDKIKNMSINDIKNLRKEDIFELIGIKLGIVRMKCGLLSLKALVNSISKMEGKNEISYSGLTC